MRSSYGREQTDRVKCYHGAQAEQTTVATDMSALQSFRREGERHGMTV